MKANIYRNLRSVVLLAGMTLGLSACVSVLPEPDAPSALYQIQASQFGSVALSSDIIIREPETVRVFASEAMVSTTDDGGLILVPGVEWAGPSTQLIQLALLDAMNRGTGDGIAVSPASGSRAPYELDWRISDLTLRGDVAVCELQLTILDGRTRSPLEHYTVRETAEVGSAEAPDRALALSRAAETAIETTASTVANFLESDQPA